MMHMYATHSLAHSFLAAPHETKTNLQKSTTHVFAFVCEPSSVCSFLAQEPFCAILFTGM